MFDCCSKGELENSDSMKAWISSSYGEDGNPTNAIEGLELKDVPIPKPGEGEVLIKISYAAVNPIDWKLFSGGFHDIVPCTHPYSPGFDMSGTIVEFGPPLPNSATSPFAVDDVVCGDIGVVETCTDPPPKSNGCCGAFAEYCVVPTSILAKIELDDFPDGTAAAIPLAGLTALQGLFTRSARTFQGENLGQLELKSSSSSSGKKVLILGGATLVGSYAIQLAKLAGAYVATTASTNTMSDQKTTKLDFCKNKLGADEVIDYKSFSWSEVLSGKEFDLIFDIIGSQDDWKNSSNVLKESSDFISIANFGADLSCNTKNNFKNFLVKSDGTDLKELVDLVKDGKLHCPIDSIVPFSAVPSAITKSMESANAGKIIIKVA